MPYLEKIAKLHKPVIISTGMATLQEIGNAVKILKKNGASEITILHCTSEYPAPLDDVNLLCLRSMKKKFNIPIKYSDHTQNIKIALAAAALGTVVYPGDNRLIPPKSPHRRRCLAPRCRLVSSWGWSRSQGLGCSPIKKVRELGSERRETVRSLSTVGVRILRRPVLRGLGAGV